MQIGLCVRRLLPLDEGPNVVEVPEGDVRVVLPPAATFRWLMAKHPVRFQSHFGADLAGVQGWWEQLLATTDGPRFWALHPWLRGRCPADLRRHVPLVIHEDAGPISKLSSAFVRSFHSVLGVGTELESRFLIASYVKRAGIEDKSLPLIMESFAELAGDVGEGHWGGILLFCSADMEHACNEWGLRHFNSTKMCAWCDADTGEVPHTDFGEQAKWRETLATQGQFLRRVRAPRHPLLAHGWFNKHSFRLDMLHILDHHGVSNAVLGNILHHHAHRPSPALPGRNVEERLAFLNADIQAYYSLHAVGNRLPALRMTNLRGSDFPDLSGPVVKATNTRNLAPYARELQRRAAEMEPTDLNKHMIKCV